MILLGPDSALADPNPDTVAEEFSGACVCCLPRGLRSLRAEVSCAQDSKTPWFRTVVREMAWRIDLATHDKEVGNDEDGDLLFDEYVAD